MRWIAELLAGYLLLVVAAGHGGKVLPRPARTGSSRSSEARTASLSLMSVVALCLLAAGSAAAEPTLRKPNIVLFVVEDMGPRVGAFGDPVADTPNLDELAAEGVRFTSVFTAAGVCAPSRAALMTGMSPISIGAQHMRSVSFRLPPEDSTGARRMPYEAVPPPEVKAFPELLRAAGYFTINNFKTDYQFGEPTTIWDLSGPEQHWWNGNEASWRDAPDDRPFFMMFSSNLTHESSLMAGGFIGSLKQLAKDVLSGFVWRLLQAGWTDPDDVSVPAYLPDTAEVRAEIARHYDNIRRMDHWVGQRIDDLREEGLLDDTVIIWTTDHGDPFPRAKRSLYDSGLHVPMTIRFPDRMGAGTINEELVSFVDLAPAILAMAGVQRPEQMQGWDVIGDPRHERAYVYATRDRIDSGPDKSRSVRDHRFKYIRNYDPDRPLFGQLGYREGLATMKELRRLQQGGELDARIARYFEIPRPAEELYDTASDPFEMTNLADDEAFGDVRKRLDGALSDWLSRVTGPYDQDEASMVRMMWPDLSQPATLPPQFELGEAPVGVSVAISSATEGASIEYRIGTGPWQLYVDPFEADPPMTLSARAIRYGFRRSPVTSIRVGG